jgi:hypothetical protein
MSRLANDILFCELPKWLYGDDPVHHVTQPCLTPAIADCIVDGLRSIECTGQYLIDRNVAHYDIDESTTGLEEQWMYITWAATKLLIETFFPLPYTEYSPTALRDIMDKLIIARAHSYTDSILQEFCDSLRPLSNAYHPQDRLFPEPFEPPNLELYKLLSTIDCTRLISFITELLKFMRKGYDLVVLQEAYYTELVGEPWEPSPEHEYSLPTRLINPFEYCKQRFKAGARSLLQCIHDLRVRSSGPYRYIAAPTTRKRLRDEPGLDAQGRLTDRPKKSADNYASFLRAQRRGSGTIPGVVRPPRSQKRSAY